MGERVSDGRPARDCVRCRLCAARIFTRTLHTLHCKVNGPLTCCQRRVSRVRAPLVQAPHSRGA